MPHSRKIRTTTICAAIGFASMAHAASFQSPSGNILCFADGTETLTCLIFDANWPKPPVSGPCDLDKTRSIRLSEIGAANVETICHGDVFWPYPTPTLSYGSQWGLGDFTCDIAKSGITCHNGAGHGFRVRKHSADMLDP